MLFRIGEIKLRVEKLRLKKSIATVWLVSVGGEAESQVSASSLSLSSSGEKTPVTSSGEQTSYQRLASSAPRWLSCFRRGFLVLLARAIQGLPLPVGSLSSPFGAVPDC